MLTSIDMANITKRESQQVLSISDPEYVKLVSQISNLWDEVLRIENPHKYYVDLSFDLWELKNKMLLEKKQ